MNYAIGDVHGCYAELKILLEDILQISKEDEVCFTGDMITKGKESLAVIEYILKLRNEGYNVLSILGNHEYRFLYLFHNDFDLLEEYLSRYNARSLLQGELDEIVDFFEDLPFYHIIENCIITHSILGESKDYGSSDSRMIFGSKHFQSLYDSELIYQNRVVHGHIVQPLDMIRSNISQASKIIGIDGGCIYPKYGPLCALELTTFELNYVQRINN